MSAFDEHPAVIIINLIGLIALLGFTLYRAFEQHKTTLDICEALKHLRTYRLYANSIEALQSAEWMQKGAGALLHLGLSGVKWLSNEVVQHVTAEKMRGAIGGFVIAAAVEYSLRIFLIAATLFVIEGRITLWI